MNYLKSILSLGMIFLLCSCTSIYDVTKIPRTPDNVKAVRECQRTAATAVGYSQEGFWKLKEGCYRTLDNTIFQRVPEYPNSIPGCQLIDDWGEGNWKNFYFLCEPDAEGKIKP